MAGELEYSKGQIDRAGKTLLRALTGEEPLQSPDEVEEATVVAEMFREVHRVPISSTRAGLRSCIASEGLEVVEVSQRLKRLPTIVDKLRRQPHMRLSVLHDVAGCRAVFETQEDVARVQERFMANSAVRNGVEDVVRDYVAEPKESGYRAVHLRTRYSDRRVEVQLRTRRQHEWPMLVEKITALTGTDYKSGYGAEEVHEWLRQLSEIHALAEVGKTTGAAVEERYNRSRRLAWDIIVRDMERRERHG